MILVIRVNIQAATESNRYASEVGGPDSALARALRHNENYGFDRSFRPS